MQDVVDNFVNKNWSAHSIAKDLNERRVLDPRSWKVCNINLMLTRHLYAGYEYLGKSTVKQKMYQLCNNQVYKTQRIILHSSAHNARFVQPLLYLASLSQGLSLRCTIASLLRFYAC